MATNQLSNDLPTRELIEEDRVARLVFRRLMWFLSLLFVCSYLDRINIGFAALSMNKELGLTSTMFGVAGTILYVAYVFAEIPSNMIMAHVGARLWIPRIMITWGIASIATIFAVGPRSLYFLRGFLGLAEAGFMPGVLLYMTYWFPPAYRARASTMFILAQPLTLAFGSLLSGAILGMKGVAGLSGWRWLFIIEGIPSILLGVIAFYYLADKPATAKWLSFEEKKALDKAIQRSDRNDMNATPGVKPGRGFAELVQPKILLLGLAYFGLVNTLIANSLWVPQIVRSVVPHASFLFIGVVAAIPSLCALAIAPFWSAHSDRKNERTWHLVCALLFTMFGWLAVIGLAAPALKLAGLTFCSIGIFSAQSIFWTLPPLYMSPGARAVGIAGVNSIGVSGSIIGPIVIGWLSDRTHSFNGGIGFVAAMLVVSVVCILLISRGSKDSISPSRIEG